MIVPKPSEEQIRSAHVITLFDPQRPEFHRVLVDTVDRTKRTPKELIVIDIAVDSANPDAIGRWTTLIDSVRSANEKSH